MPWGAAIAGVAAVGGSMLSSSASSGASKKAIAAQERAAKQLREDLMPYTTAGTNALAPAQGLLGINGPEAAAAAMEDFQTSPGYDFAVSEGLQAVERSAAAQGMGHSGATMKALQARGSQLANQEFGTYYNRLMGLTQLGQNSAAGVGASNTQTAAGIAQTQASAGTAQANIYANAASGLGNIAGQYMQNSVYSQRKNELAPSGGNTYAPAEPGYGTGAF